MLPNRKMLTTRGPAAIAVLALIVVLASWAHGSTDDAAEVASPATVQTGPSGLPLPRFVSLKSDRVNVRAGPGQSHRVAWVFSRAGLPVEIVAEFENWRRIRDSDGSEGWVFHSLLSGRRTGVVAPWSGERRSPSAVRPATAPRPPRSSSPACWSTSRHATAPGAVSTFRTSTASFARSTSGASIRGKSSGSRGRRFQRRRVLRTLTTTSICVISSPSGAVGSPEMLMSAPSMSISRFSSST